MSIRPACFGVVSVLLAAICRATPESDARAVLKDFLDQPSYSWLLVGTRGLPEGQGGHSSQTALEQGESGNEATMGQHEKGGYTKVFFVQGVHIPKRDWPSAKPWPGYMDRDEVWSQRWVFETPKGVQALRELPNPAGLGITFRRELGFRRPDHEIAIVLAHLASVSDLGAGEFSAELTPAGAALLAWLRPPPSSFRPDRSATNATASIKFQAVRGKLGRYEISLEADLPGGRVHRVRTLSRQLTGLGTTSVELPAEVRRKFED